MHGNCQTLSCFLPCSQSLLSWPLFSKLELVPDALGWSASARCPVVGSQASPEKCASLPQAPLMRTLHLITLRNGHAHPVIQDGQLLLLPTGYELSRSRKGPPEQQHALFLNPNYNCLKGLEVSLPEPGTDWSFLSTLNHSTSVFLPPLSLPSSFWPVVFHNFHSLTQTL